MLTESESQNELADLLQAYDDWKAYEAIRPYTDERGNFYTPDGVKFKGEPSEYFDQKREEYYKNTLAETKNSYDSVSMSGLAHQLAEAKAQNDKTKFAELDVVLSQRVESFADSVTTKRNPNGLPPEAREAMHARLRRIVDGGEEGPKIENKAQGTKGVNKSASQNSPNQPNEQPATNTEPKTSANNSQENSSNLKQTSKNYALTPVQVAFLDRHPDVKKAHSNWLAAKNSGDMVRTNMAADELNYKMYNAAGERNYKVAVAGLYNPPNTLETTEGPVLYDQDQEVYEEVEYERRRGNAGLMIGAIALAAAIGLGALLFNTLNDEDKAKVPARPSPTTITVPPYTSPPTTIPKTTPSTTPNNNSNPHKNNSSGRPAVPPLPQDVQAPPSVNLNDWSWQVAHELRPGHEVELINSALSRYTAETGTPAALVPHNGTIMIQIDGHIVHLIEMQRINQIIVNLTQENLPVTS